MRNIKKLVAVLCVFKFGALGLGALAMLHLAGSTAAQQMTETLFNVFPDADSVEPAPKELARLAGAIRQAKVPRECPLGELTIYTPKGNDTFQQALSDARRDAVLAALERLGLGVAGRLFVNEVQGSAGKFDVGYSGARDDKPPTLTTTSQPKKGSKVKAGQTITVTMVARDDADHLQTGIESIRLIPLSDGGRDVAPTPMRYGPCSDPREKRVVATYVVPDNPPPVLRLRACAWDHANNQDCDVAEFPTQETWAGSYRLERDELRGPCSAVTSEAKFTIQVAGDGEVSGNGTMHHSSWTCVGGFRAPATDGALSIGGKKQKGIFTLFLKDVPDMTYTPRLPIGQWIVPVGQGITGEATVAQFPGVIFRVKLDCQTCGQP
jgi:hypothetical protein